MEFGKFKFPSFLKSNNFIIWALVIFVVLGFSRSSNAFGFNFFGAPPLPEEPHKGSRRHYQNGKVNPPPTKPGFPPIPLLGNISGIFGGNAGGFLGGNGLFLLVIVAILFLCKDDKKENCDDVAVVDYAEVEN